MDPLAPESGIGAVLELGSFAATVAYALVRQQIDDHEHWSGTFRVLEGRSSYQTWQSVSLRLADGKTMATVVISGIDANGDCNFIGML